MISKELFLLQSNHNKTKRNYLYRMQDEKVNCMKVAKNMKKTIGMGKEGMVMEVTNIFLAD